MPEVTISFATTAAAGTNGMAGNRLQNANYPRILRKIGVTGSAAVGDTSVDLFIDQLFIGSYLNTTVGVVRALEARDFKRVDVGLLPNDNINVMLGAAPTTNALGVTLILEDLPH